MLPNIFTVIEAGQNPDLILSSIDEGTWDSRDKKKLKDLKEKAKEKGSGKKRITHGDTPHGDGYADSNRPWTLVDPENNKAKAPK